MAIIKCDLHSDIHQKQSSLFFITNVNHLKYKNNTKLPYENNKSKFITVYQESQPKSSISYSVHENYFVFKFGKHIYFFKMF